VVDADKLKQGKKAVIVIFEGLNARYTGEFKKDSEKEVKFLYSKFSPLADGINQEEKVQIRDILSLIQTNLVKLYVDMKEKEKIYQFFATNQKQMFIDEQELIDFLMKQKDEPINNIALALLYE